MKFKMYILLLTAVISSTVALAQPVIGLQKTIGGNLEDRFTCMSATKENGLVIGGFSNSNKSGNKTEKSKGNYDFWILVLNSKGAIVGQKTIGGDDIDQLSAVEQTLDGGYILGGYSASGISGDKTENTRGTFDYWVVKLDSNYNIQWDKTIGGNGQNYLYTIKQTSDGGYLAGGYSSSGISGEKTENTRGGYDYWIVKLDSAGNIQWDKTIGGSGLDQLKDIIRTNDGGYLLGGLSASPISGEKTQSSRGDEDYWVVKVNNEGNIQWNKTYGGDQYDGLSAMVETSDGGYLLGGNSASGISGEKMQNNRGKYDYWIVKTDNLGEIKWSKTYGGNKDDFFWSVELTPDDGYLLGGSSVSGVSGEKTEVSRGETDFWVVKLSSNGAKQWDKTIGGTSYDDNAIIKRTGSNRYVVGGFSSSGIGGDKTESYYGMYYKDYWLVELRYSKPDSIAAVGTPKNMQVATVKSDAGFSVYPNPAKDVLHIQTNGKATVILTDQSGKTIFTKTINGNGEISVANLPAGLYYLKNNETGAVQKVTIAK